MVLAYCSECQIDIIIHPGTETPFTNNGFIICQGCHNSKYSIVAKRNAKLKKILKKPWYQKIFI